MNMVCWIIGQGLAGTQAQCEAVAAALGVEPVVKRVDLRAPWRWLSPPLVTLGPWAFSGDALEEPWPDLVIAAGRRAVAPALYAKRMSGAFTVFLQNPRCRLDRFDLVAAPEHDGLTGPNVITTLGAPNRVTPQALAAAKEAWRATFAPLPTPRIAVLIGGGSRAYRFGAQEAGALAQALIALPGSIMATPSRRTGAQALKALGAHLSALCASHPSKRGGRGGGHTTCGGYTTQGGHARYLYDGRGANPYLGMLAWADHIVVTADSASMLSDAASTGAPVHIWPLPRTSARAARRLEILHRGLVAYGAARPFSKTLEARPYTPLQDAQTVAHAIKATIRLASSSR